MLLACSTPCWLLCLMQRQIRFVAARKSCICQPSSITNVQKNVDITVCPVHVSRCRTWKVCLKPPLFGRTLVSLKIGLKCSDFTFVNIVFSWCSIVAEWCRNGRTTNRAIRLTSKSLCPTISKILPSVWACSLLLGPIRPHELRIWIHSVFKSMCHGEMHCRASRTDENASIEQNSSNKFYICVQTYE